MRVKETFAQTLVQEFSLKAKNKNEDALTMTLEKEPLICHLPKTVVSHLQSLFWDIPIIPNPCD